MAPAEWVLPTSTEFPRWMSKTYREHATIEKGIATQSCDPPKDPGARPRRTTLFPHQKFVQSYLGNHSPYRGLLLFHGLGVGKTCSSIAVAEAMQDRSVCVLLPAALRTNYVNEIKKCGNDRYVKDRMHWRLDKTAAAAKATPVSAALRRRHGGLWVAEPPTQAAPTNFKTLTAEHMAQVQEQINDRVDKQYTFYHYNGMTKAMLAKLTKGGEVNPFDGKVVVVDEVHNLVSGVSNRAEVMSTLYDLVMRARRAKVVLLSGTPIINKPFEVGLMINLVKGPDTAYVYEFKARDAAIAARADKALRGVARVDWFRVASDEGKLAATVTFYPEGFSQGARPGTARSADPETPAKTAKRVLATLKEIDPGVRALEPRQHLPFPDQEDEFDKHFVDDAGDMRNEDVFTRRTLGAVSYFVNEDPALYPAMRVVHEDLRMSDHQFEKYVEGRHDEYKLEKRRKKPGGLFDTTPSVYKAYTRALCNFAFPNHLERPRPKDAEFAAPGAKKSAYHEKLDGIVAALTKDHLDKHLAKHSPKFARAMELLRESPGCALIYSQFRNAEGVAILSRCLKVRGYKELRLKHVAGEWDLEYDPKAPAFARFVADESLPPDRRVEFNTILLAIYNDDFDALPTKVRALLEGRSNLRGDVLRVLFITQSGAEGISLKNVRQVHVMEPYWNQNRIDQVVGRARRMCSHSRLEPEERNFTVFLYRMTLSHEQIARQDTVVSHDRNATTDEHISEIAARKARVVSKFIAAIRRGATDCAMHNAVDRCYVFPVDVAHTRAYTLEINRDFVIRTTPQTVTKNVFMLIMKNTTPARRYVYMEDTHELFDAAEYERDKVLVLRGSARPTKDGDHYAFEFL